MPYNVISSRSVSVCVCVWRKLVLYRNCWTNRAGFWHEGFLRSQSYAKAAPASGTLSRTLDFRHCTSIVATYCQISSTKVDARCDKVALPSLELSWNTCEARRSIDTLGQFIALSVHLCVYCTMCERQHVVRVHVIAQSSIFVDLLYNKLYNFYKSKSWNRSQLEQ